MVPTVIVLLLTVTLVLVVTAGLLLSQRKPLFKTFFFFAYLEIVYDTDDDTEVSAEEVPVIAELLPTTVVEVAGGIGTEAVDEAVETGGTRLWSTLALFPSSWWKLNHLRGTRLRRRHK